MDDLISRQDVIDVINTAEKIYVNNLPPMVYAHTLEQAIMAIPAQPHRTGRWIDHAEEGYVECLFCHSATNCDGNISDLHFCFSCGARMEGE